MLDWNEYFPHDKTRTNQVEAIDFAIDTFTKKKKRFVIIEAGTGVGKSAIGLTVARYLEEHIAQPGTYGSGAYFLTTQKILQEQYAHDFIPMKSLKSSSNYTCNYMKKNSCAESLRAIRTAEKDSAFFKACMFGCVYKQAKDEFLKSKESVTNFSYFLAETTYSGKITPRSVLVIDEAHNTAGELSKFIEVTITERFARHALKLQMPELKTQSQAIKWIQEIYAPKLHRHIMHIEDMLEKYVSLKDKLKEFTTIAKQFDLLDKHMCKLRRFLELYDKNNWICNLVPPDGKSGRKIEFKPIDVAPYAEDMLFRLGKNVIMMSATILDHDAFCTMLGIDISQTEFISIPSPFPIQNRPIFSFGIGSMASQKIENTLPKLAMAVQEILDNHPREKGIIHCHTFRIAKYLKSSLKSRRLLIHNSQNRDEVLQKHKKSKTSTVLLSPSMTEGVDLKDDISRFQIICKIPYPYLGDKLIRKKMNKWKWWYPLQTAKTIMQAAGRSVRSESDHAVTYILDSDWDKFYNRNKSLFNKEFQQCLKN